MKTIRKGSRQEAMLKHLKAGFNISIRSAYVNFGVSNPSREIRRLVEVPLGIELRREKGKAKTKYGSTCTWTIYSATPSNKKKIAEALKNQTANK
jgi:hypothetical protein